MKTAVIYQKDDRCPVPFPNAATRRQILGKFLDTLLIAACGMGLAAMVVFLLAIG